MITNAFNAMIALSRETLTARQVSDRLGISEYAAMRALKSLIDSGYAVREKAGGTSYYTATVSGSETLRNISARLAAALG